MSFLKSVLKFLFVSIGTFLKFIPGYRRLIHQYCGINNSQSNVYIKKIISLIFFSEYYKRSVFERMDIQMYLMSGDLGVDWANYYDRQKYPPLGSTIGVSNWEDVVLSHHRIFNYLSDSSSSALVIQVGASSGKEIYYFAKAFPQHSFIYTDIDSNIVKNADSKYHLSNLKFAVCTAEFIPAIVSSSSFEKVLIFSMGSLQYVYPEHLSVFFENLSIIAGKEISLALNEPGNVSTCEIDTIDRSIPRGNFSYTHNYRNYASVSGFSVVNWDILNPFPFNSPFFKSHRWTVIIDSWFSIKK